MGYRSEIILKTTAEGYTILKQFNDSIAEKTHRPFYCMNIEQSSDGCYKIWHDCIKWYDSYPSVQNFDTALSELDNLDIPYKFLRIGEDLEDLEEKSNWTDDTPCSIDELSIDRTIYDSSEGSYTSIENPDK